MIEVALVLLHSFSGVSPAKNSGSENRGYARKLTLKFWYRLLPLGCRWWVGMILVMGIGMGLMGWRRMMK
jgi:hypothetical protein